MASDPTRLVQKGKRKVKRVLFSRTAIIVLLLLLQLFYLLGIFGRLRSFLPYTYGGMLLLNLVAILVIVNRKGNPSYKLAWMLPVTLLPVFGIFLYLFLDYQLGRRLVYYRQNKLEKGLTAQDCQKEEVFERLQQKDAGLANLSRYLYQRGHFPVYQNTKVRYFPSGEAMFEVMLERLETAESFIFMEYFSFEDCGMWNTLLEVLSRKAAEGVEVRFMYDGTCSFRMPYHYADTLRAVGIQCRVFNQIEPVLSTVQNNRDHRKITVIDGHTAFTGGINLEDAYINAEVRYGYWKDTAVLLEGEAVRSFTSMFLQAWQTWKLKEETAEIDVSRYYPRLDSRESARTLNDAQDTADNRRPGGAPPADGIQPPDCTTEGFVIPYGDSPMDNENIGESVYMDILYSAKRYVHIMTPYLILDNEMVTALTYAAGRGIDVKIIMPGIPDKWYAFVVAKTFYPELLEAGVKIYQFQPGFVHAKSFVSDDDRAVVGTINLDYRSLYLHYECAVLFAGMDAVGDVEADFQATLSQCREITPEICRREKLSVKLSGRFLRLIAPLM